MFASIALAFGVCWCVVPVGEVGFEKFSHVTPQKFVSSGARFRASVDTRSVSLLK